MGGRVRRVARCMDLVGGLNRRLWWLDVSSGSSSVAVSNQNSRDLSFLHGVFRFWLFLVTKVVCVYTYII